MLPKKIYLREADFDDLFTSERMVSCDEPYRDINVEFTNLSEVWHDAGKMPNRALPIIIEIEDDIDPIYEVITVDGADDEFWEYLASDRDITRWAYVSDLLSKGEHTKQV